jgi:hypothetical protein
MSNCVPVTARPSNATIDGDTDVQRKLVTMI